MEINGLGNMTDEQLDREIALGSRFVVFEYCISLLIITMKRGSAVHYLRPGESAFVKSLPYIGITLLFGWWGIPWGPIYTIWAIVTNLGGGRDVTYEIMNGVGPS